MVDQLRRSLRANLALVDTLALHVVAIHLDEACHAMPLLEHVVDGHAGEMPPAR